MKREVYRYPPKRIDRPEHISALVPTRARVAGLKRLFENFQNTIADRHQFDVWLYVDSDDGETQDYIRSELWKSYEYPIHWHIGPTTRSMGDMFNTLWQSNTTNPGIYFPCGDDCTLRTKHWDNLMREAFAKCPDTILLGFLPEPSAAPYQVTYPVPGAQWLNTLGYFMTNRFYFWFDDMWLDDIAQMAGRKILIPAYLENPEGKGKTPRMRNLRFWNGYFRSTLKERFSEACRLIEAIYPEDKQMQTEAKHAARVIAAVQLHKLRRIDLDSCETMEAELRENFKVAGGTQIVNYLESEFGAIQDMLAELHTLQTHNNSFELIEQINLLSFASCTIPEIRYLQAMHLDSLGYTSDALTSIDQEIELFPNESKKVYRQKLLEKQGGYAATPSFYQRETSIELPAWLGADDNSFLLFPEEIDQELFYCIQRIIYDDPTVSSFIDVGSATGNGSTRAILEATHGRTDIRLFCIEPDSKKAALLKKRYGNKITLYEGLSVAPEDYISEHELKHFYDTTQSIYNFFPFAMIQERYRQEIDSATNSKQPFNMIRKIKNDHQIMYADVAILDGSLFCGRADLAGLYGAKYLVLNYVWSTKNYDNIIHLVNDKNYKAATGNLRSRCGYTIFERVTSDTPDVNPECNGLFNNSSGKFP